MIVDRGEEVTIFTIYGAEMADAFRAQFNGLWDASSLIAMERDE